MKFSLPTFIIALSVPSTLADSWNCNGCTDDGNLKRLSITFNGYCENQFGQCFLYDLKRRSLDVHNWQSWKRKDGLWQADFSLKRGSGRIADEVMQARTGISRRCWNGE